MAEKAEEAKKAEPKKDTKDPAVRNDAIRTIIQSEFNQEEKKKRQYMQTCYYTSQFAAFCYKIYTSHGKNHLSFDSDSYAKAGDQIEKAGRLVCLLIQAYYENGGALTDADFNRANSKVGLFPSPVSRNIIDDYIGAGGIFEDCADLMPNLTGVAIGGKTRANAQMIGQLGYIKNINEDIENVCKLHTKLLETDKERKDHCLNPNEIFDIGYTLKEEALSRYNSETRNKKAKYKELSDIERKLSDQKMVSLHNFTKFGLDMGIDAVLISALLGGGFLAAVGLFVVVPRTFNNFDKFKDSFLKIFKVRRERRKNIIEAKRSEVNVDEIEKGKSSKWKTLIYKINADGTPNTKAYNIVDLALGDKSVLNRQESVFSMNLKSVEHITDTDITTLVPLEMRENLANRMSICASMAELNQIARDFEKEKVKSGLGISYDELKIKFAEKAAEIVHKAIFETPIQDLAEGSMVEAYFKEGAPIAKALDDSTNGLAKRQIEVDRAFMAQQFKYMSKDDILAGKTFRQYIDDVSGVPTLTYPFALKDGTTIASLDDLMKLDPHRIERDDQMKVYSKYVVKNALKEIEQAGTSGKIKFSEFSKELSEIEKKGLTEFATSVGELNKIYNDVNKDNPECVKKYMKFVIGKKAVDVFNNYLAQKQMDLKKDVTQISEFLVQLNNCNALSVLQKETLNGKVIALLPTAMENSISKLGIDLFSENSKKIISDASTYTLDYQNGGFREAFAANPALKTQITYLINSGDYLEALQFKNGAKAYGWKDTEKKYISQTIFEGGAIRPDGDFLRKFITDNISKMHIDFGATISAGDIDSGTTFTDIDKAIADIQAARTAGKPVKDLVSALIILKSKASSLVDVCMEKYASQLQANHTGTFAEILRDGAVNTDLNGIITKWKTLLKKIDDEIADRYYGTESANYKGSAVNSAEVYRGADSDKYTTTYRTYEA